MLAPAVIYSKHDTMHTDFLKCEFDFSATFPTFIIPSSQQMFESVALGLTYGLLPDVQIRNSRSKLFNLRPKYKLIRRLYWHSYRYNDHILNMMLSELQSADFKILSL